MKRYEQSVRVITAFFSVLLGLGLKNLLDPKLFEPENARWPCFLMSVFLFLRFLLGSNNHMWFEFVRPDREEGNNPKKNGSSVSRWQILKNFFFLLVFGLLGVSICFSTTVDQFLKSNLLLTGIAILFCLDVAKRWPVAEILYRVLDCVGKKRLPRKWDYWLWVNLIQFVSTLLVYLFVVPNDWGTVPWWLSFLPGPAWDWSLFILVVVYFVIFAWDFSRQLEIVQKAE